MTNVKRVHPFISQRGYTSLEVFRTTRKATDTIEGK